MEILSWLQKWYADQCDGEWEHDYGITISTLDNPGWSVKIDLFDLNLKVDDSGFTRVEVAVDDWYDVQVKDNVYSAGGGPLKLSLLLEKFRGIILNNVTNL